MKRAELCHTTHPSPSDDDTMVGNNFNLISKEEEEQQHTKGVCLFLNCGPLTPHYHVMHTHACGCVRLRTSHASVSSGILFVTPFLPFPSSCYLSLSLSLYFVTVFKFIK